jgi:hypothetical protein
MADDNARELARREDKLFGLKGNLDALNQELALNFYPERADFTLERALGEEFAIDLFDSEPLRCRRDLGNARAAMLRPRGQQWFRLAHQDDRVNKDPQVSRTLDYANTLMRSAMYQARTGFVRAEKEADHDEVTFGNAVKTIEASRGNDGQQRLMERCWHLRDCAWLDDADGIAQDFMARRFKASARHIKKKFPDAPLHASITQALDKEPDKEFKLCHIMMLSDEYEYYKQPDKKLTYVSIYYDSEHKMLLSERPSNRFRYIIDRWATLSGSQYGYSPAAMTGLSDGRGMQTMALVLLEAGEKTLDPPLKAVQAAIKGGVNLGAGQITWVDRNYDERTGPVIEPLLPGDIKPAIGIDLINRTTLALRDTWYLTKLTLPQQAKTAFETAQLVEEFIRANIPLFEPWENGIDMTLSEIFEVLKDIGALGSMRDWPAVLSGQDLEWKFANPLQDAIERNKVNQFQTALGLGAGAVKIDPNTGHAVDWVKGLQDAVRGSGSPADWLPDEKVVAQKVAASTQAGNVVQGMQAAEQAANIAKTGVDAAAQLHSLTQPAADGSAAFGPT